MQVQILFPVYTNTINKIHTLQLVEKLTKLHESQCRMLVNDSGKIQTLTIDSTYRPYQLIPIFNSLTYLGCTVYSKGLIVSLLYDLVSLSNEMSETELSEQIEECITLIKLKHENT